MLQEKEAATIATILFCEDNPGTRKLIDFTLRASAHRILIVDDGAAGLEIARAERPDLLVTDLAMPRMDGIALFRAVRADSSLDGTKIVFLSASGQRSMMEEARTLEADAIWTKPFSPANLLEKLERILAVPARAGCPRLPVQEDVQEDV